MADAHPSLPGSPARRQRLIAAWPLAWGLGSIWIAILGMATMAGRSPLPPALRGVQPHADPVVAMARLIAQEDSGQGYRP